MKFAYTNTSAITGIGFAHMTSLEYTSVLAISTCNAINEMASHGASPDIVMIKTNAKDSTIILKRLFRKLGIPTLILFHKGEFNEWDDLSEDEEKYLIQIQPPSGVILNFVKDIVSWMNSGEDKLAVALLDKTFRVDIFEHNSLLIPIMPIADDILEMLRSVFRSQKVRNVFVVGSLMSIGEVFKVAYENNFDGPEHHWFAVTNEEVESFDLGCGCGNMWTIVIHPKPVNPRTQVENLRKSQNISATPDIDMAFYFDTTVKTMKAIAEMKSKGKWPQYSQYIQYRNFTIEECVDFVDMDQIIWKDLNLRHAMASTTMVPTYGHILVPEKDDGIMAFALKFVGLKFSGGKLVYYNHLGAWRSDKDAKVDFAIMKFLEFYDDEI